MADVWPYVAKEADWVYYQHLLEHGELADPVALARFRAEYPALTWGTPEVTALIEQLVPNPAMRWDWNRLDRPADGLHFADRAEYQSWIRGRLAHDHTHARLGPAGSAIKATSAMIRDLRNQVRQVISHQGLSGTSYTSHIERWFSGLINYVASGPPASRIEELIALVDAGVLCFVGPGIRITHGDTEFLVDSPSVEEEPIRVASLVEARLQESDIRRAADPLLRYLWKNGQCRAHRIPNADGRYVETGGLDIAEFSYQVFDADGVPHPGRFSYGPPVESVQWVTAVGARPHVNSGVLLQGDVIARGALTTAVTNVAHEQETVGAASVA